MATYNLLSQFIAGEIEEIAKKSSLLSIKPTRLRILYFPASSSENYCNKN
jgi:hypothetical protein